MKHELYIASFAGLMAAVMLVGCAGTAYRHEKRVDRRGDTAERIEDRSSTRQENRYDRRDDRQERRVGY